MPSSAGRRCSSAGSRRPTPPRIRSSSSTRPADGSSGHLPSARHDTGAAAIGRYAYVFGGGDGVSQLDQIVRVDPATGSTSVVGKLPAASSDSSAAAIGGTAYVVGGYTGTQWLNTIVAWRPGASARVVARLPFAVRYAAVASAGGHLVIAGGSLQDGSASSAVFEFTPGKPAPVRIGTLAAATTHATAAAIGMTVYVIGGRGANLGSATNRIVSVSVGSRKVAAAGVLRLATLRPCGRRSRRPHSGRRRERRGGHGRDDRRPPAGPRRRQGDRSPRRRAPTSTATTERTC